MSDVIVVKRAGKTYEIPGIWCAGLIQSAQIHGQSLSIQDAIRYWIDQCAMEEAFAQ